VGLTWSDTERKRGKKGRGRGRGERLIYNKERDWRAGCQER